MERESIDFDANRLRRLRSGLTRWYARNARDLPWRRTGDAYSIWISEIMLQQTTVATVIPYFERFLKSFPTIGKLARAAEDEVLRHWEGLGYYSRARNIHKTARQLAAEQGGRFPESVEELVQLPGIGRYTAGAIASFAFDVRAPIVEANTLRLYCRLLGYDGDPRSTAGQRLLWEFAERILPRSHAGRFNQALMELGGTLCTPSEPDCETCPVRSCCTAFAQGRQAEIPVRARRPEVTAVTEAWRFGMGESICCSNGRRASDGRVCGIFRGLNSRARSRPMPMETAGCLLRNTEAKSRRLLPSWSPSTWTSRAFWRGFGTRSHATESRCTALRRTCGAVRGGTIVRSVVGSILEDSPEFRCR